LLKAFGRRGRKIDGGKERIEVHGSIFLCVRRPGRFGV